jgi:aquaporin Z
MIHKFFGEFIGTAFLVYIILATMNPLAIGAALALDTALLYSISGGHVNPAVSIVYAAAGKLPTIDLVPYILAQCLGGLTAFELFKRVKI